MSHCRSRDEEVALLDLDLKKTVASLQLGHSTLAGFERPPLGDFTQLAMSTRSRGAVWDLARNLRVQYVRGFRGGWFDKNHSFFADFPSIKRWNAPSFGLILPERLPLCCQ